MEKQEFQTVQGGHGSSRAVYQELTVAALYHDLSACEFGAALLKEAVYPWEVLPRIHDYILKAGVSLPKERFEEIGEHVWAAKSAKIAPTASITGPCIIDEEAEIRHCAFIRGNAIIGKHAVVGNSTELKNVILFDRVQVPHYNYVGDSVLGEGAHMGAGSITSNVKSITSNNVSDKKPVVVHIRGEQNADIDTGMKKFGAILGDYAEIGCGAVLNPGTVIGAHANVYPLSSVRCCLPAFTIYKSASEIVKKTE